MTEQTITTRAAVVQEEIERACQRVGRDPATVTLVAVSKMHPPESVVEAAKAGLRHFGENRMEEALEKIPAVQALTDAPLVWHMVGHIQSRKARQATRGIDIAHSIDNRKVATRLSDAMVARDRKMDVMLEINVSGERSKYGWSADRWERDATQRAALWADVGAVLALPGLRVRGLMTMAPIVDDPEDARPHFIALRTLRDALAHDFSANDWSDLSMGMSDDYVVAVEEGATFVRIGRAIFGPRPVISSDVT